MTPRERAEAVVRWLDIDSESALERVRDEIEAAVAAEREACIAAMCRRCAAGEPLAPAADCASGPHESGPCHEIASEYVHNRRRYVSHERCKAAAIRARGAA